MPTEELLFDLKGGNGRHKKKKAEEELERRGKQQAEKELQAQRELGVRRQQWREREEWLRKTFEEREEKLQAELEEARLEEEQRERERVLAEQEQRKREAEEARRKQLREPTTCSRCGGSGKCTSCSGSGCISVTYLAPIVNDTAHAFRGKTFSGCLSCGGRSDGAELLELDVLKGHGRCTACKGSGQIRISEAEVEAAMQCASVWKCKAAMQQAAKR